MLAPNRAKTNRRCLRRKLFRIGRLSGTGAPPCLAWRAGLEVGRVGEVGPRVCCGASPMLHARALFATTAKLLGRVRAMLRRASKRWTSSSRSALVAWVRGTPVPAGPRVRSATCRASTRVAAHSGVADETPLDRSVGGSEGAPVPRGTGNVDVPP